MSIINIENLASIREKHKNEKIVFCAGTFDLTHVGHVLFFEDCKKFGEVLVAMTGTDFNQRLYKGEERPILNQYIRLKMIDSIKPVDYALLDRDTPDGDFLAILQNVFEDLEPDFYIVNEDAFDIPRRRKLVKNTKTKLIILKRTCPPEFENISTTGLIKKIKKEKK